MFDISVMVAILSEVKEFSECDPFDLKSVKKILKEQGFKINSLSHILLHGRTEENGEFLHKTQIRTGKELYFCSLKKEPFDAELDLRGLVGTYIHHYEGPYLLLTDERSYPRVAKVLNSLGYMIEELQPFQ